MSALQAYSAYKESGVEWIGQIPAHWQACRTKFVAKLYSGHTPSRDKPEYWVAEECTIPWFTLADVWQLRDGTRTYLGDTSEKISPTGLANSAARLLPAGTVIVSRTASVGFAGIMPRPMATTQDFVNWVCGDRIRPRFLLHVFRAMRGEFSRLTMGSTHQTIYMPDVRSFSTPLPSLDEQEEIVAFLDRETARIDALIAKQRRLIDLLREKQQAVISHAVTKGLDPGAPMKDSGIKWLGQIPTEWAARRLGGITSKITNGYVGPTRDIIKTEGIKYLQSLHIKNNSIIFKNDYFVDEEWSKLHSKSILKKGDVLIVQTGDIGQVAFVTSKFEGANCHALIVASPVTEVVCGEYLAWALYSNYGFHALKSIQTGALHPHLNCGNVKDVWLPLPPMTAQRAIVAHVDRTVVEHSRAIQTAEKAIDLLGEHRTLLTAAAVTGKIDVRAHPTEAIEAAD